MATDAAITLALNAAVALAIPPSQMVALLDRAIASAIADNAAGPYVIGSVSDGTSLTYASLETMQNAREYYRVQVIVASNGGVFAQNVEFSPSQGRSYPC